MCACSTYAHRPNRGLSLLRTDTPRWFPLIVLTLALSACAAPNDDASTDAGADVLGLDTSDATGLADAAADTAETTDTAAPEADAAATDADAAPANPYPGTLALVSPLALQFVESPEPATGCDWNDDGKPDNGWAHPKMGKELEVDLLTGMVILLLAERTFVLLPSLPATAEHAGKPIEVSAHETYLQADGKQYLFGSSLQTTAAGYAPKQRWKGQITATGLQFATTHTPGQPPWPWIALPGDGETLWVDLTSLRADLERQPDGTFTGTLCFLAPAPQSVESGLGLTPDIDHDGDGTPESLSGAIRIRLDPTTIHGVAPKK